MTKGFAGILVATWLVVGMVPYTVSAQSPPASLLVRCMGGMNTAQGEIVYAADNSLTLHLDFTPPPASMPGEEQASVTGNLNMTCSNPTVGYSSAFGGEVAWFGWDFEHRFAPVLAQMGSGLHDTEPCFNPHLDVSLSLNGEPPIACEVGFFVLTPDTP